MTIRILRCSGRLTIRLCAQSSASPSIFSFSRPFAQHQPQRFPGPPPRCIRRLVDDMPQIVQTSGFAGLPSASQRSRACPPFQALGCETKDFDLHTAPLQCPRKDIGAHRRHRDRAARMEPELSISRVTMVSRNSVSFSIL